MIVVLAPAVVATVAVVKVMSPVCEESPKIIDPVDVEKILANSESVRLIPVTALFVPPMLMGSDDTDGRNDSCVSVGFGTTLLTEFEPVLTTHRLP